MDQTSYLPLHPNIMCCYFCCLFQVQCGVGRTGLLWAHEAFGVAPDMMTVAKPLAGKSSADTDALTRFSIVTQT